MAFVTIVTPSGWTSGILPLQQTIGSSVQRTEGPEGTWLGEGEQCSKLGTAVARAYTVIIFQFSMHHLHQIPVMRDPRVIWDHALPGGHLSMMVEVGASQLLHLSVPWCVRYEVTDQDPWRRDGHVCELQPKAM
jgi:hypothetical protein